MAIYRVRRMYSEAFHLLHAAYDEGEKMMQPKQQVSTTNPPQQSSVKTVKSAPSNN